MRGGCSSVPRGLLVTMFRVVVNCDGRGSVDRPQGF